MEPLIQALNGQLANFSVLYVKLHNYHWNIKGPQFFTLHAKFQELYEETALHVDEIAERILTLKGRPLGSMREYVEHASVREAANDENAEAMVSTLIDDYSKVIGELKAAMELAGQQDDETTADMLLAIHTQLEKHIWMLSAFNNR